MATRVFLVRHGQSEGNVARIWTSGPEGYPLTELGHDQARAVAPRVADAGITAVYTSNVLRAKQTGAHIAAGLDLPTPPVVQGIHEWFIGPYEDQHDDVVAPIAAPVFRAWLHDSNLDARIEGGESGRELIDRGRVAIEALASRHPNEAVLIVAHGGLLSTLLSAMCPPIHEAYLNGHHMANCAIAEVEVDGDQWRAIRWDDAVGSWF